MFFMVEEEEEQEEKRGNPQDELLKVGMCICKCSIVYLFYIVTCAYIDNDMFTIGERAGDVEGLSQRDEYLFA